MHSHSSSSSIRNRAKRERREREEKQSERNSFFSFCKIQIKNNHRSFENVQQLVPRRRVGSGVLPLGLLRLDARAVLAGLLALEGGANLF
jgi:hypothetical protein